MNELLSVLAFAALPVAGNALGGLIGEVAPLSERWLNRGLHAAAGVVVAVIAVEIMPEATRVVPPVLLAAAFTGGGLAYLAVSVWLEDRSGEGRMWMLYLTVATDLFGDGLMIGAGTAVSPSLGLVLAVGQVLADVPEGFASMYMFRDRGLSRARRLLLLASFALPAFIGATAAFFLLRGQGEAAQYAVLSATAGLFIVAVFEDMIHEAHETTDDSKTSTVALIAGFALFLLVSTALG